MGTHRGLVPLALLGLLLAGPAIAKPPVVPSKTQPITIQPAKSTPTTTTPKIKTTPSKIVVPPKPTPKKIPRIPTTSRTPGGSGRNTPTTAPKRFTAPAKLRDKGAKGAGAIERFGSRPSDGSKPAKGKADQQIGRKKPGHGTSNPTPGSQSDALAGVRSGSGTGEGADGSQPAGDGSGNPIRDARNARVSNPGTHVWGGMDFETAHISFLGSTGYFEESDGRQVRINSGVGPDGDWVLVQVNDQNAGEHRRYEYVNGNLVQTERSDANGNRVTTTTDPATGDTNTTVTCVVPPCPSGRINPDAVPRGTPPPAFVEQQPMPDPLDPLIQYGPDGNLPELQVDPGSLPDPLDPLINPGRDDTTPRPSGEVGEADPAGVRNDPLIHWTPDGAPHEDPPPAAPGKPTGTKSPKDGGSRKEKGSRKSDGRDRPTSRGDRPAR